MEKKTSLELVRERDKYTCQNCGKKGDKNKYRNAFDVHHIDWEMDGHVTTEKWNMEHLDRLVTLCRKCHALTKARKNVSCVRKNGKWKTIYITVKILDLINWKPKSQI